MFYLNLFHGHNIRDVFTSLSSPGTINGKYHELNRSLYSDVRILASEKRINRNVPVLRKFRPMYKVLHPRTSMFIEQLYEPFLGRDPVESINKMVPFRSSQYPTNLFKATIDMREITGLNNVNIAYDFTDSTDNSIRVCYDVNRESIERFSNDRLDPLSFNVSSFGFPDFVHHENVVLSIFIPLGYIRESFKLAHSCLLDKNKKNITNSDVLEIVTKRFGLDFKNALIIALYKDRFRELFNSQMMALYHIILEEIKDIDTALVSDVRMSEKIALKYVSILRRFKMSASDPNYSMFSTYNDNLISIVNSILDRFKSPVNVWAFYNMVIDFGLKEVKQIIDRINLTPCYVGNKYYADIDYLNRSKLNEFGDTLRSTLLLCRSVPYIYFTECLIGYGTKTTELKRVNTLINNYIDSTLVSHASKYHKFHRNSLSYLIDKVRDFCYFNDKCGFRAVKSNVLKVMLGISQVNNNVFDNSVELSEESIKEHIDNDIKKYVNSVEQYGDGLMGVCTNCSDKLSSYKGISNCFQDFWTWTESHKQKNKAPKNIEEMFDLVRERKFTYVGYHPCHNINIGSSCVDDETVIENGQVDVDQDDLVSAKREAVEKVFFDLLTKEMLKSDDMDTNENAKLGNVLFLGNPGTEYERCCFVYNRKNGDIVMDGINRGFYHSQNFISNDDYAKAIQFYNDPVNLKPPFQLYEMYSLWSKTNDNAPAENPEDYVIKTNTTHETWKSGDLSFER